QTGRDPGFPSGLGRDPGSTRRGRARNRSAPRPSCSSCRDPSFAGGADNGAIVLQAFRLELEPRQAAVLNLLNPKAQTLVGLRQRLRQLGEDASGVGVLAARNLDQHLDLVLPAVSRVEMDAELVDLLELADDRFHSAGINVGTPDQLHVVDSPANAAFVDVEGASAGAGGRWDADHEVTGPISQDRDHPATERGDQPLAQFAVTNWVAGRGVDHLFDVVVLDDVRPAWLLRALEDHDGAHLGHAGGIRRLRTPLFLDEALGRRT